VVRNDAVNLAPRADEDTARTALVQHLCDKITEFKKRFDILEARVNEAEGYRRTPLLSASALSFAGSTRHVTRRMAC